MPRGIRGDDTVEIKIMTFNIRHGLGADNHQDLRRVIEVIDRCKPDLVGINEVDVFNPRSKLANQPEKMGNELNFYRSFAPTLSLGMMKYGNCLLSRWPIVQAKSYKLPSLKEQRGCLEAVVDLGTTKIRVLVTHLGLTHQERLKQFEFLQGRLKDQKLPQVLMGDFNCTLPSDVFAPYLLDSTICTGGKPIFTFPAELPSTQIDYIFVSSHFTMVSCMNTKTVASDHLPIITTVTLG